MLKQEEIDKLAEIFVYLDLLSAMVELLVLYEQWQLDDDEAAAEKLAEQELSDKLAVIEERLNNLEAGLMKITDLLADLKNN